MFGRELDLRERFQIQPALFGGDSFEPCLIIRLRIKTPLSDSGNKGLDSTLHLDTPGLEPGPRLTVLNVASYSFIVNTGEGRMNSGNPDFYGTGICHPCLEQSTKSVQNFWWLR